MRNVTRLLAAALAPLFVSAAASAQRTEVSLAVNGGAQTDQRGVRSSAATVAPSVLFLPDSHFSLLMAGSGTQYQTHDWSAGATLGAGLRIPMGGHLALAASSAGTATTTSYDARYLTADLTPTLEASLARLTFFGGAHVAQGSVHLAAVTPAPAGPLGTPAPTTPASTTTRTSAGPVYGAVLALPTDRPDVGGALVYREERARVQQLLVLDRTLSARWTAGLLALAGLVGTRDASDEAVTFGSVSAQLAVGSALALQASAGNYASSRTLGTPGGRYVTLGLALRHTAVADEEERVAPLVGVPRETKGTTRLIVSAPGAHRVELAGDWNQWATMPATRAEDGRWYADVRLPRGEYRYAFRIDGERWAVPDGVVAIDDGYGGRSALLTVP